VDLEGPYRSLLGEEIKAKGDTCTKTWDLRGPYRSMMGKGWKRICRERTKNNQTGPHWVRRASLGGESKVGDISQKHSLCERERCKVMQAYVHTSLYGLKETEVLNSQGTK
jgi:hypothetical protein